MGLLALVIFLPLGLSCGTLLVMAWWGKPAWSAPYCRKCRYDLRGRTPEETDTCPECGADLTGPRALRFVRGRGKRWVLAVWAVLLLISPFGIGAGLWLVQTRLQGPGPGHYGSVSTATLIQTHLPQRVDQPWVWQELEARIQSGALTPAEGDDALDALTQHLQGQPSAGVRHISWQRQFLADAHGAGLLSDTAVAAFSDAYFGPQAQVDPLPRMREGRRPIEFVLRYGSHASDETPWRLDWEVVEVQLDGESVDTLTINHQNVAATHGRVTLDLTPGEHEVAFVVEAVYLDRQAVRGIDLDSVPVANWPDPKKRWRHDVKTPLRVHGRDETVVEPIADPSLNPASSVRIDQLAIQPHGQRERAVAQVNFEPAPAVPVSFDIVIDTGQRRIGAGSIASWPRPAGGQSMRSRRSNEDVSDLGPSIRRVDVHLVPNARHVDHVPDVTQIWGEPIVIEDVELVRLDLPAEPIEQDD